jgi:hypothetical protein
MENEKVATFLNRKIFDDLDRELINKNYINEINKILSVYDNKSIKNRLKNIYDFIKYDVEGDWLERLYIIQNVLKNDVMSDYALEIRYGKNNMNEIKKELIKKTSHTKEGYINKYGENIGIVKWEEYKLKSKTPWGLDACILKFGEKEGNIKWEERLNKKVKTQKERKLHKPYRNGRTLLEYQDRYGIEDGYKKWFKRNEKHSYRFSKKYYFEKYGEKNGLIKWFEYCKKMDKTSLESLIEKNGIDLGKEKYEKHLLHLKYISSELFFIEKYGNEIGKIKYQEKIINNFNKLNNNRYSKISQELFWFIHKKFDGELDYMYFAELNKEYLFYPWSNGLNIIEVDFKYKNKIIEFDGDYWHSKPEQIEKDILRDKYLISNGYQILRVKEIDYKNDKEKIITECLMFLNN